MNRKNSLVRRSGGLRTVASSAYLGGLTLLCLIPALYAISYLASGNLTSSIVYSGLSLLYLWMLTPAIVCHGLEIYRQKHFDQRNYLRVDHAYTRAIAWMRQAPVSKWAYLPSMTSNLALTHMYEGHYDSAETLFKIALDEAVKDKRRSARSARVIYHYNYGSSLLRQEKYVEAELQFEDSLQLAKTLSPAKASALSAWPLFGIAGVRLQLGEFAEAQKYFAQAIEALENPAATHVVSASSAHLAIVRCHLWLALLHARQGDFSQAKACGDNFLAAVARNPLSVDTLCLKAISQTADEFIGQKMYREAEPLLDLGYSIASDCPFHPDSQILLSSFETLLLSTGRKSEVDDMRHFLREVPLLAVTGNTTD